MTAPDALPIYLRLAIDREQDAHGVITLVLRGEIDLASATELEFAVVEALSLSPSAIVIDLAGVDFVDSRGLRTLMVAQEHAAAKGLSLILRHVQRQAQRLFELSGTADAFVTE